MPERELDAYLAEHLFGLVGCTFDECREAAEERDHYHYPGHGWGSWKRADRYSSTGDGMLLVLEALRARGYVVDVFGNPDTWIALGGGGARHEPTHHRPRNIVRERPASRRPRCQSRPRSRPPLERTHP